MQYMRYLVTILTILLPFQFSYLTLPYGSEVDLSSFNIEKLAYSIANDLPENRAKLKKVVLDAGHGGKDHGCTVRPNKEKDIALNIVLELGNIIEEHYPEVEVIYTRKKDVFVPLYRRIRMANESGADLFISVHCNYSEFPNVKGSESYVMGLHTAVENLNVAKRENSAVLHEVDFEKNYDGYNPNSPAGHIILSMYQHAYLEQSISLAQKVEYAFNTAPNIKSRGVKQAGFVVLKKATMPSVLIETGYLSNKEDAKRLRDINGQKTIARSIFKAFENYKNDFESIETTSISYNPQIKKKEKKEFKNLEKEELKKPNYVPKVVIGKQYRSGGQNVKAKKDIKVEAKNYTHNNKSSVKYKIQIAASNGKPLKMSGMKWKGLDNLETKVEDGMYKYLVGNHKNLSSALEAQTQMRALGFNGAFVVAYDGEERIGLKKAKEIASKKNNF
jgi:N-acetylmuramoyl-L-alanine amidase